jgi:hypothetical protein
LSIIPLFFCFKSNNMQDTTTLSFDLKHICSGTVR